MSEQTVQERLEEVEKVLEKYSEHNGTDNIWKNDEVTKSLNFDSQDLSSLSEEDCLAHAYLLNQYSAYLQKSVNRENAKFKWASHNLDTIISTKAADYGDKFTKWEQRKLMVINDNEYAKALNKVVLESSIRIEELSFISTRVAQMGERLSDLAKAKRSQHYVHMR